MIYTLKNEYYEAKISSVGAELISLVKDGRECIWQAEPPVWTDHAPLLFPICGRIKDGSYTYRGVKYEMAGHGFTRRSEFKLVEKSDTGITLSLEDDETTRAQYPFSFSLTARYELAGEDLTAVYTVKNNGEEVMPYMFGWHPGFVLFSDGGADINDYYVDFGKLSSLGIHEIQNGSFANPTAKEYALTESKVRINEEYLYPRDTLVLVGHEHKCVLGTEKNGYKVKVSWSDNIPVLALWKFRDHEAKFFCIEPWTGMPNDGVSEEDFETRRMDRLAAGDEAKYSYRVSIEL